jgi:hypothetical protein
VKSLTTFLALGAWLALSAATAGAGGFTVVEEKTAQGGDRLAVRCNEAQTVSWRLPADARGAKEVKILQPTAGQVIRDGFGEKELARVQSVGLKAGDPTVVEIVVVGSGAACESSLPGAWETDSVEYRASYKVVSHPKVYASDEQAGLNPRQRPRDFSAAYQVGWRGLKWQSWGGKRAVARGRFQTIKLVPIGYTDVVERKVSYPVRVTLSKIDLCGGERYYYTRISTKFLKPTPASVRREAHPLGTAGCLK